MAPTSNNAPKQQANSSTVQIGGMKAVLTFESSKAPGRDFIMNAIQAPKNNGGKLQSDSQPKPKPVHSHHPKDVRSRFTVLPDESKPSLKSGVNQPARTNHGMSMGQNPPHLSRPPQANSGVRAAHETSSNRSQKPESNKGKAPNSSTQQLVKSTDNSVQNTKSLIQKNKAFKNSHHSQTVTVTQGMSINFESPSGDKGRIELVQTKTVTNYHSKKKVNPPGPSKVSKPKETKSIKTGKSG